MKELGRQPNRGAQSGKYVQKADRLGLGAKPLETEPTGFYKMLTEQLSLPPSFSKLLKIFKSTSSLMCRPRPPEMPQQEENTETPYTLHMEPLFSAHVGCGITDPKGKKKHRSCSPMDHLAQSLGSLSSLTTCPS